MLSLLAVVLPDWTRARAELRPVGSDLFGTVPILAFATVGALIVWRQPRNRIGWLLIASGFMAVFLALPRLYAGLALDLGWHGLPGPLWAYWFSTFDWVFVLALFLVLVPLFYPDGRLPGRRWRFLVWLCGLVVGLTVLSALDPSGAPRGLPSPVNIPALVGLNNLLTIPITVFVPLSGFAAALSLALRFRRGSDRDREQLKWLIAAFGLVVPVIVLTNFVPALQNAGLIPLAASAIPIAIGIAVLRYRLYDIDLIINKALVYGGLALVITAIYVLIVINIGALVGGSQRLWLSWSRPPSSRSPSSHSASARSESRTALSTGIEPRRTRPSRHSASSSARPTPRETSSIGCRASWHGELGPSAPRSGFAPARGW